MASNIDPTVPKDNVKVDKSLLRANAAAAKEEIEALQAKATIPRQIAFGLMNI